MKKSKKPELPASNNDQEDINFGRELAAMNLEVLLYRSKKINEGNNGIINILMLEDMDQEMINFLETLSPGFSKRESVAVKLIKIYSQGVGKHEYEMQSAAYDAMLASETAELPYAKIPKPLFYKEVEIASPELKQKLIAEGLQSVGDKIEVLIMDLLPGEDLATHIHRQVVKIAKDNPKFQGIQHLLDKEVQDMSLAELQSAVGVIVGQSKPGGNHRDADMNQFENLIVKTENSKKTITFLKKNGYVLNKEWLNKIENTVNTLHDKGIFHRDLHERNVMVNPDNNEVYILDFGTSIKINPASSEDVYEDLSGRKPDDMNIVTLWKELTTTDEEDQQNKLNKFNDELNRLALRITNKDTGINIRLYQSLTSSTPLNTTVEQLTSGLTNDRGDTYWKIKLTLVKLAAKEDFSAAIKCLDLMANDANTGIPASKMISMLRSILDKRV